jgi:hypothetical protein
MGRGATFATRTERAVCACGAFDFGASVFPHEVKKIVLNKATPAKRLGANLIGFSYSRIWTRCKPHLIRILCRSNLGLRRMTGRVE